MLNLIVSIVGSVGVIGSLLLVAWQTRELTRQTRVNNVATILAAYHNTNERLHAIFVLFVEDPTLRPYFFDNQECPPGDPRYQQVLTIGEMLADAFDYSLTLLDFQPPKTEHDGWQPSSRYFVEQSPIARMLLRRHPTFWPYLYRLCRPLLAEDSPKVDEKGRIDRTSQLPGNAA